MRFNYGDRVRVEFAEYGVVGTVVCGFGEFAPLKYAVLVDGQSPGLFWPHQLHLLIKE